MRIRNLGWALLVACCSVAACTRPGTSPTPTEPVSFQWRVEIVQDGEVLVAQDDEIQLHRSPFVIRVVLSTPLTVRLHVSDSDEGFRRVQAGTSADTGCCTELLDDGSCWPRVHPFCSYAAMAYADPLFNEGEYLHVAEIPGEGYHLLYYNGPDDHRWDSAEATGEGMVFERRVSNLLVWERPLLIGTEPTMVPIEQYVGSRLYLLFLVKYRSEDAIGEDELRRVVLVFDD